MKKLISLLCALAMILSMMGCQQQSEPTESTNAEDYRNTTLTGKVTAIDGTTVTLQLGELTEMDRTKPGDIDPSAGGNQIPEMGNNSGGFAELPSSNESENTPPEMPEGEAGETPPEVPTGEQGNAEMGGVPPQKPDGEQGTGEMGSMPGEIPNHQSGGMGFGGSMNFFAAGEETVTMDLSGAAVTVESMEGNADGRISDIAVENILVIEVGENTNVTTVTVKYIPEFGDKMGQMNQMGKPGGNFGGSMEVTQGTSANTIDTDGTYTDTTYSSTGDDENALRVDGATVSLEGITVNKESGATSNTESGDFYGMNAALLATDGANVTINGIIVNSSAQNGNGVFSYGDGTVVTISDSTIVTTADNSGGIQTTGGGTTNAYNLDITTSGSSAAAIRSDRGGGIVNVDGGTYTSNGFNSPAVYSTAAVTVKNSTLTANNSEALVIEGKNSMVLENCIVIGNMSDTHGTSSDINVHNVMIYQSMSGDADVGTSVFSMTGGSLTSNNGDMFYVTNTRCILTLSGVDIINHETGRYFLLVSGNDASRGWGKAGANGGQVEFTADGQIIEGDIAVDTVSALTMVLTNGSVFTGTINIIENEQNGTAVDNNAVITIDSGCNWTLTGDCTINSLTNNGMIDFNGFTITLADGTVLGA